MKLPILAIVGTALIAAPISHLTATPEVEATRLTSAIGTGKMEGAVSDLAGNFYFCNMNTEGLVINQFGTIAVIPAGKTEAEIFVTLPRGIRGNGLRIGPDGHLYMADQLGGSLVRINTETKAVDVLWTLDHDNLNWNESANDVAITPDGKHLYVSCMKLGVYRMGLDGSNPEQVIDAYSNGVEVSPDGSKLIIASGIYAINDDGTVTDTGVKFDLPKEKFAYTDGLRCDAEGNVYISRAGKRYREDGERKQHPGGVHVFAPDGSMIKHIVAPHGAVHNVGFGGPDGRTLFLICPGNDGFVATYQNDIPGRNQADLARWGS